MLLQPSQVEPLESADEPAQSWDLPSVVQQKSVRLLEISSPLPTGVTSTAVSLLLRTQAQGDPVAWIAPPSMDVFAPDLASCGVDLNALIVIQLGAHYNARNCLRVAEWLLRSGGFGLVVADLRYCDIKRAPVAWQNRLYPIAERYAACLCLLTSSSSAEASFGPLVHLRIEPQRAANDESSDMIHYRIRKDKIGLYSCQKMRVTLPEGAQGSTLFSPLSTQTALAQPPLAHVS